jgi:hypothetical protein
MKKRVKAPKGFHWMKKGAGKYSLMRHSGTFKKHAGASLTAEFNVQMKHSKAKKK